MNNLRSILAHQQRLSRCHSCPDMIQPVIIGHAVMSEIILVGQAPGDKEGNLGKPFAWTAGKTLFKWFESIGVSEQVFRQQVYISAVCRCFPGKNPKGGDRVPNKTEIASCSRWINKEIKLLQPRLIIPVGKLAISQYLKVNKLVDVVGQRFQHRVNSVDVDIIPLPHPSGASTWHRMSPGKELLEQALNIVAQHESWKKLS